MGLSPQEKSKLTEARFRAHLAAIGATLLESEWLGSGKPHHLRCAAGHDCSPRPHHVLNGHGICRTCAGVDPKVSEQRFRDLLDRTGAQLLEPRWLGVDSPHRIRCANGHEVAPTPKNAARATEICRVCARRDSQGSWTSFREKVQELGGQVIEVRWLGSQTPHRLVCPAGHACSPRPAAVLRGQGLCPLCSGNDSGQAWQQFRELVAQQGGVVLETEWRGNSTPHLVRCSEGHLSTPRPGGVQQRGGICARCSKGSHAAELDFLAKLAAAGATSLEPRWLGSDVPHRVLCSAGHVTSRLPTSVRRQAACRRCSRSGDDWDIFYVVANDRDKTLKFGVTSRDPRTRLGVHRADGLDRVIRLLTGLPVGVALDIERSVKSALRLAGETPVRGVEYFPAHVLGTVLDIVDHHPGSVSSSRPLPVLTRPQ